MYHQSKRKIYTNSLEERRDNKKLLWKEMGKVKAEKFEKWSKIKDRTWGAGSESGLQSMCIV